jgi:hypothetical protein
VPHAFTVAAYVGKEQQKIGRKEQDLVPPVLLTTLAQSWPAAVQKMLEACVTYLTHCYGATTLAPDMLAARDGVHPADVATRFAIAGVAKNEIAT